MNPSPLYFTSTSSCPPGHVKIGCSYDQQNTLSLDLSILYRFGAMMNWEHHEGKDKGKVVLYALSTCGWCGKVKQLLTDLGIDFSYVYVDRLPPAELKEVYEEVKQWNPHGTFPTLVLNGEKVIVGFREREIREALV